MKRLMHSALVTLLFSYSTLFSGSTVTAQDYSFDPVAQPVQPVANEYIEGQEQEQGQVINAEGYLFDCDNCGTCPNCALEPISFIPEFEGFKIGGWIQQGVTFNPDDPVNRFNGPVTYNDRSNDYQINQVWLYIERPIIDDLYGWDIGGRVDALYGMDHRFTVANGLEDKWNLAQRFYGVSLPQFYIDLAINNIRIRAGHFFSIIGAESVQSNENFFYSHTYSFQYGEPTTLTGVLASWSPNDRFIVSGGVHRGWDNFDDNNNNESFMGRAVWFSPSKNTELAVAAVVGDENNAGDNTRSMGSVAIIQKFNYLKNTFQFDYGYEQNVLGAGQDGEWYGFVNTLVYEINPCLSIGARYEWFSDDDGVRVVGLGAPGGITWNPIAANWQAITSGVNIKPHPNVLVRSEVRWDEFRPLVAPASRPFNDFSQSSQILWSTDVIISY